MHYKHRLEYDNYKIAKESDAPKTRKRKKTDPETQRKKARKPKRNRIHKSKWPGLIEEFDKDTSKGKKPANQNEIEFTRVSGRDSSKNLTKTR